MELIIKGTLEEIKEVLQAIESSKEHNGKSTIFFGKTAPDNPKDGDFWLNPFQIKQY